MVVFVLAGAALVAWYLSARKQPLRSVDQARPPPDETPMNGAAAGPMSASLQVSAPSRSAQSLTGAPAEPPAPNRLLPKPLLSSAPPIISDLSVGRETSPDPNRRQRAEARAAEAKALDARLERHIAELRARLEHASPAEQRAISTDLELLQRNLTRRRAWENDGVAPMNRSAASNR
jgi:hypothetical protein